MKKFYFLLIALCFFTNSNAQVITFTDSAFENLLVSSSASNTVAKDLSGNYFAIDVNMNAVIEQNEALNVSYIDVASPCSDLEGIQYFTNLHTLISNNSPLLTAINVSGLVNLEILECRDNPTLSNLVVTGATNLRTLDCSYSALVNLNVSGLTNLQTLLCFMNQLSALNLTGASNLEILNCYSNSITGMDLSGLTALEEVHCAFNRLTALDVSTLTNLRMLDCSYNQLLSLNTNGLALLENLNCDFNAITNLSINESVNLQHLSCEGNLLTALPLNGFSSLVHLNCHNNLITAIDLNGLSSLRSFNCGINQLQTLDIGMLPNLQELFCPQNLLTSLNLSGNVDLQTLDCSFNQLTSLNASGLAYLEEIFCLTNQLATLNVSGTTALNELYCNNNQLQSIDVTDSVSLTELFCNDNPPLVSIFMKNGRDETLAIENTPLLEYICADESQLDAVQDYAYWLGYTNCHANSYCSFVPGGTFYTIQGAGRFDSDSNGCDVSDVAFQNLKFNLSDGTNNGTFISNASGNYHADVPAGIHTITPTFENPTYFNCTPSTVVVEFPTEASPFAQDFCVTANGAHPDLEVAMLPTGPARPGFDASYKIIYKNKGTNTQSGTLNLEINDAALDLVTSIPATSNQTLNNLSWDFTNLQPFETREITLTLNVNSPMETPAVNDGDILNFTASVISAATDETSSDNTFNFNQTVVNSYDPNDKTCLEGATISPSEVGKYVHYMIRFENTGTFPAENIVVKDMIDTNKFDINTLVPIKGSHSFITNITSGNKVEFIFENINLPFDDANNDGYVAFKIKTKPTLVVGNTFSNSASIYFDYNFPIVTNTATTTIAALSNQDFAFETYFSVYPNPAKNVLNIETKQSIEVNSINIYNQLGQLVLVVPNAQDIKSVDVSNLASGNYFIKINSEKGTSNTKFIKN